MKLLFIDTETGGLNPQTDALFEVALVVWEDGVELAGKTWKIKTGDKMWHPSALEINNIVVKEHNREAVDRDVAAFEIMEFLDEWFRRTRQHSPATTFHSIGIFSRSLLRRTATIHSRPLFHTDCWIQCPF